MSLIKIIFLLQFLAIVKCFAGSDQVKSYYENINQAELLLIADKLPAANLHYQKAFDGNLIFPVDIYNTF